MSGATDIIDGKSAAEDESALGSRVRMEHVRAALFNKPPSVVKIDRFTLLDLVGAGSMGEVYAAYDERLDRKVALKLVRADVNQDAGAGESLLREAQTLAQLSHPNIVHVYDVGSFEGRVFIAMEFVRGQTLLRWLDTLDGLPSSERGERIVQMFLAVGRGLEAAHDAGLTHRDVKPGNILVGDDGRVRVVDFGLAHVVESPGDARNLADARTSDDVGASTRETAMSGYQSLTLVKVGTTSSEVLMTGHGIIVGTPAYMAPELFDGRGANHLSDQFSFCVALHEAFLGERPYVTVSVQAGAVDGSLAGDSLTGKRARDIPVNVQRVLVRGLSVEPNERFPDMGSLLIALQHRPHHTRSIGIAMSVAIAFLVGLALYASRSEEPVCTGADTALTTIWNPQRKQALERVFASTDRTYAGEVQAVVSGAIDAYTDSWKSIHRDACLAHREGTQTNAVFDRRSACLDHRRGYLDDSLTELENTDASSLSKAPLIVSELPSLADCSDVSALMRIEVPPSGFVPEDPTVDEPLRQLNRAMIRVTSNKHGEALSLASSVAETARQRGDLSLEARALTVIGRTAHGAGGASNEVAFDALRRAVEIGFRNRRFSQAIEAFARLVHLQYVRVADEDRGLLEYATFVEALAASRGEYEFSRVLLLGVMGSSYMALGEPSRAHSYFSQAVDRQRNKADTSTVEMILAKQNLAIVTEDADVRTGYMLEVSKALERTLGPSHPFSFEQTLHTASYTVSPQDAYEILQPTCRAYRRYHIADASHSFFRCYYLMGFLAADLQRYDEAVAHLRTVIEHASPERHRTISEISRGYIELFEARPQRAYDVFEQTLARLPPATRWWHEKTHADAYLGLGLSARALHRHDRAIEALEQALSHYRVQAEMNYNTEHQKRLAWTRFALARSLMKHQQTMAGASRAASPVDETARIRQLTARARAWYQKASDDYAERLWELDAWRDRHDLFTEAK